MEEYQNTNEQDITEHVNVHEYFDNYAAAAKTLKNLGQSSAEHEDDNFGGRDALIITPEVTELIERNKPARDEQIIEADEALKAGDVQPALQYLGVELGQWESQYRYWSGPDSSNEEAAKRPVMLKESEEKARYVRSLIGQLSDEMTHQAELPKLDTAE